MTGLAGSLLLAAGLLLSARLHAAVAIATAAAGRPASVDDPAGSALFLAILVSIHARTRAIGLAATGILLTAEVLSWLI